MHELALAEGIVSAVLDLARKKGGRVIGFKVAIGELAQFDKRLIEDLLRELIKGTELKDAHITVEVENAIIKCLYCDSKWGFQELVGPLPDEEKEMIHFLPELLNSFSRCPTCGRSDLEIEGGRSIRVVEVELDV
jgi:hydrogenase nickel incorporation protein HypA/HybF